MKAIIEIKSENSGPNLLIMAGVHGNEPSGIKAVQKISQNLKIKKGSVTFILGNPAAIERNVRFIESNLNRCFLPESMIDPELKNTLEYKRSREILPFMDRADALLDLHSSATPDSVPFAICQPDSFDIASVMPGEIIVTDIDKYEQGGSEHYMNMQNKKALGLECGYHLASDGVDIAGKAIDSFLGYFGLTDYTFEKKNKRIIKMAGVYKNKTINFKIVRQFKDFEFVKKGELIAHDEHQEVMMPEDGLILFARDRNIINQEAFLWAKEER